MREVIEPSLFSVVLSVIVIRVIKALKRGVDMCRALEKLGGVLE